MYADKITDSMEVALSETKRRRAIQNQYNLEHNITPTTIQKAVRDLISISKKVAAEQAKFEKILNRWIEQNWRSVLRI